MNESVHGTGVTGLPISSNMSYEKLHSEVQSLCNVDQSQYDIEMRFLLPANGQFQVPVKIISSMQLQWFLGLNKQGQHLPICVTLVNKDQSKHLDVLETNVMSCEVEVGNDAPIPAVQQEMDDQNFQVQETYVTDMNQCVDWNELEIIPHNGIEIPIGNCENSSFSTLGEEFVQCRGQENHLLREHRATSSSCNTSNVVPNDFNLQQGQIYTSKKDLELDVHLLALKYNFEFKVKKSNKSVYTIVCIDENCKWCLRATKFSGCDYFQIRKYTAEHTCFITITHNDHKQAKSWIVGKHIKGSFEDPKKIYRPLDIINDVRQEFGIELNYQKARRYRESALEYLRGSHEDNYAKLPAYSHNLVLSNPGTVYHLEVDNDSRFKYFFLAFGSCIRGFHSSIRPVVVVDGTFFTAKYRGTLIVANCQDGNMQLYPLAWGIVDSENDDSLIWFLKKLKEITCDGEDLVVIYDRNQSLINAIGVVYENARHGHCIYHIKGNLRTKTKKSDTYSLFKKAAEAYTKEEFNKFMHQIQNTDYEGWNYLDKTNFEIWARSYFQGNRYNIMTSNNAESLNALFKKDRQGPVLVLIERIGKKLQELFLERGEKSRACTTRLTHKMEEKLCSSLEKGKRFKAEPIDQMKYVVTNGTVNFIVDFEESTCTCRKFQLDRFPCEHVIAAARKRNYSVYLLCSDYYTTAFWRASYDEVIFPAPNESEWVVTDDIEKMNVLPPCVRKRADRQRLERVKSTGEFTKRKRCSRCRGT